MRGERLPIRENDEIIGEYESRVTTQGWECESRMKAEISSFFITLICVIVLCLVISAAPQEVAEHPWVDVWLRIIVVLFVALLVGLFNSPINQSWKLNLVVGVVSLFLTTTVFLTLKNTPYSYYGTEGDQSLYTIYVTKFANYNNPVDFIYKELPPFYPPLYYYVLGRVAALYSIPPFQMIKYGLLGTLFLIPFLTWWFWRLILDPKTAVALAFVPLVFRDWVKTGHWVALTMFVPWWLYWVENICMMRPVTRRGQVLWVVTGGFIGSLIFQIYYYWFFIGGISLLLSLVIKWRSKDNSWNSVEIRNALLILLSTAFFSSIYWLPYLLSMYVTGGWELLQNRWMRTSAIPLPLPFLELSIEGLLLAGGLCYLLLNAERNKLSNGLLAFLIAIYVWIILGYVGILLDRPLLTLRAYPAISYILAIAAMIALMRLWQERFYTKWFKVEEASLRMLAFGLLFVFLLFFSQNFVQEFSSDKNTESALIAKSPDRLLSAFDSMTNQQYLNKVILSSISHYELLLYRPVYSFVSWTAHYSHPAARFHDRIDFLEKLSATNSPTLFAAAFMNNRYDIIDFSILENKEEVFLFSFRDDDFPNGTKEQSIAFTPKLFDEQYFQVEFMDNDIFLTTLHNNNPLSDVNLSDLSSVSPEKLALLYTLATTFGEHVKLEDSARLHTKTGELLAQTDLTTLPIELLLDLRAASNGELLQKIEKDIMLALNSLDIVLADTNGNGQQKLRVLGYTWEAKASGSAELVIYFEVLAHLERDYTIWLHANVGETQHNLDHLPQIPTSAWQSGQIYQERFQIELEPNEYHVSFGLWDSNDKARLFQSSGGYEIDLGRQQIP